MSRKKPGLHNYLIGEEELHTKDTLKTPTSPVVNDLSAYGREATAKQRYDNEMAAIGKSYDTDQKLADSQHRDALRQQAQHRADSKREAYIAHERLQKYLPQARAVSGIEGMGMTETAKVQGLNAYLSSRSAADAAYAQGVSQLEGDKMIADTERSLARQTEERNALNKYLEVRESVAEAESAAMGSIIGSKAERYFGEDGKLSQSDYNALEAYVNANADKLTHEDRRLMEMTLEGYRDQIRTDAEQMAYDRSGFITKGATFEGLKAFKDGKNLTVKLANGTTYALQLDAPDGASVTDTRVLEAAKQTRSGDVFGYGGRLYLNNNGEIYAIEARENSAKEDYAALYDLFFQGGPGKTPVQEDKSQTLEVYGPPAPAQQHRVVGGQGKYRGRN